MRVGLDSNQSNHRLLSFEDEALHSGHITYSDDRSATCIIQQVADLFIGCCCAWLATDKCELAQGVDVIVAQPVNKPGLEARFPACRLKVASLSASDTDAGHIASLSDGANMVTIKVKVNDLNNTKNMKSMCSSAVAFGSFSRQAPHGIIQHYSSQLNLSQPAQQFKTSCHTCTSCAAHLRGKERT